MLLFLGQLPPPIHGAAVMNLKAHNAILEAFPSTLAFNISNADSLDDVGSASLNKILKIAALFIKIIVALVTKKISLCYFSLCPSGAAFYRDTVIVAILKAFRVKRVIHLHGRGVKLSNSKIKRALFKFAFSGSDVIHLSPVFWSELEGLIEYKNFWVVPNCADDLSLCQRSEVNSQLVNFFYFSNFVRGKGPLYLLQAAKIMHESNINCRISLAGGWFDLDLKEEIEQWQYDNAELVSSGFIKFYGPLHGEDKINFIRDGDVLVFPSYIDTFPLVVVEALSAGKAVVASATGAVPEILNGGACGILFPEHDVNGLVKSMKCFVDEMSLINKFGCSGRKRYEAIYQESAFKEGLIGALNSIIDRG